MATVGTPWTPSAIASSVALRSPSLTVCDSMPFVTARGVQLGRGSGDQHVVELGERPAGGKELPEGGEREAHRAPGLLREDRRAQRQ